PEDELFVTATAKVTGCPAVGEAGETVTFPSVKVGATVVVTGTEVVGAVDEVDGTVDVVEEGTEQVHDTPFPLVTTLIPATHDPVPPSAVGDVWATATSPVVAAPTAIPATPAATVCFHPTPLSLPVFPVWWGRPVNP